MTKFGRNFVIFVKSLFAWYFFRLNFFIFDKRPRPIKHPVQTSPNPKVSSAQEGLIGHLRYLNLFVK